MAVVELMARRWETPVKSDGAKRSPYAPTWKHIVSRLRNELALLGAVQVIIEMDVSELDLRNDGWIRSDARPRSPGVRVFFKSRHGDLRYEAGTWSNWEHNLYAIARTLQAQRMILRDGAVKGEQVYMGFKALPGGGAATPTTSTFDAWVIVAVCAGVPAGFAVPDAATLKQVYREAAQKAHPDAGGSAEQMTRLNNAKQILAGLMG